MTNSSDLPNTLWWQTLVVDAVLLVACWFLKPLWLLPLAEGMALGQLYLLTLRINAQKPGGPYLQVAISLTRVAITAYAVVILANAQSALPVAEAAVLVIAGCFSYKVIVAMFALKHIQSHLFDSRRGVQKTNGTSSLDHH